MSFTFTLSESFYCFFSSVYTQLCWVKNKVKTVHRQSVCLCTYSTMTVKSDYMLQSILKLISHLHKTLDSTFGSTPYYISPYFLGDRDNHHDEAFMLTLTAAAVSFSVLSFYYCIILWSPISQCEDRQDTDEVLLTQCRSLNNINLRRSQKCQNHQRKSCFESTLWCEKMQNVRGWDLFSLTRRFNRINADTDTLEFERNNAGTHACRRFVWTHVMCMCWQLLADMLSCPSHLQPPTSDL